MNSLVKTIPYGKVYKQKERGILLYAVMFVTSPFLLLVFPWIIFSKDKFDKCKFEIKALEDENNRKNYLLDEKEKAYNKYKKQQQEEQDQITLEHIKRVVQTGNHITVTENRTYSGGVDKVKEWWLGN